MLPRWSTTRSPARYGVTYSGESWRARLDDVTEDFGALHIERYPLSTMMRDVLALRDSFTVYDAAYVVLAQALRAPLITADFELAEARRVGVDVRVLPET
jgi:predicted nucleic acid-binding protein